MFRNFSNFSKSVHSFHSFEIFSKNRLRRDDSFGPKIVEIGAILAIFRPFETFKKNSLPCTVNDISRNYEGVKSTASHPFDKIPIDRIEIDSFSDCFKMFFGDGRVLPGICYELPTFIFHATHDISSQPLTTFHFGAKFLQKCISKR